MKKLRLILLSLLSIMVPTYAQDDTLRIATTQFLSPYVMQGKNQLYGFDIAMMSEICTIMKRDCRYQIMTFEELLPAVANKKVDIAVNAITITAERAKLVTFSIPYLVGNTRFLGKSGMAKTPVTLKLLENSKIGIKKGSIFADEIKSLGIISPNIVTFMKEGDMIAALISGSIDLALVLDGTAKYWQAQSNGELVILGEPIPYGAGLGIAVNHEETALLQAINQALVQYQNSKQFKNNFNMYLHYF